MTDGTDSETPDPDGLRSHPLTAARLEKVETLTAAGVDPYPVGFTRTDLAADLIDRYSGLEPGGSSGDTATVGGRVMLRRSFGKLVFLTISDVSGRIQLFVSQADLDRAAFALIDETDVGDWVGATGEVITTRKGELSVRVHQFDLLAKSLRPLPEKWHGLSDIEARSRNRHVDLIMNPDSTRIARTRASIISQLRREFEERGFIEVETPVLLPEAGGALARPFATHHDALDIDMFMRIATELHLKRLIVGGLEKVFEIGRIFRNEGFDSTHNPEFTMLESYEALADFSDVMCLVEEVVSALAIHVHGTTDIPFQGETISLAAPFRRVAMLDLVNAALEDEITYETPLADLRTIASRVGVVLEPTFGAGRLVAEIFEAVAESDLAQPTFVTEHPIETSPLARRHRDRPYVTERFELFIGGSEYANGYSELNDPVDQRRRFEDQARARAGGEEHTHPIDEEFIRALEYGMPPTGGLGIGVDRLVMLLTDQRHIRDVILFPTMRPRS